MPDPSGTPNTASGLKSCYAGRLLSVSMPPEIRTKHRLQRHPTRRLLGGVCAGIADYTGTSCLIIRILAVALFILPTGGLLLYLALWLVLPVGTREAPDLRPSILSRLRQRSGSGGG